MLGYHISVFRQGDGGSSPARVDSEKGPKLAVWQADPWGLGWIDELVKNGQAIDLGGNGYPFCYTAKAEHLIQRIIDGPPLARKYWASDPGDVLGDKWEGKTTIDRAAADACRSEEWLLIVAFDES